MGFKISMVLFLTLTLVGVSSLLLLQRGQSLQLSTSLREKSPICAPLYASSSSCSGERPQSTTEGEISQRSDKQRRAPRARKTKHLQKDLLRSPDGIPIAPLRTTPRATSFGSTTSGGSGRKRIMNQGETREKEISNPNKLRIIGGVAKGKKIESPDVYLRPMMAKVREALFSSLGHLGVFDSTEARVLDIFSGSGSVGLEALSRGAKHVTFVDMSPDCTATAMKNVESCGFSGQGQAVCARAEEVLRSPENHDLTEPYDLISMTPPYEEVIYKELIDALSVSCLLKENTLVVIEYPVEMGTLPYILGEDKLFGVRNRKYGRTILGLYVYRPTKKFDMRPDEFQIN